jgi:phosphoribosylanthranilate isomerase
MRLVKICGLTREEDVEAAVACGADLAGFVFTTSPRRIDGRRAACLRALLAGTAVRAVGVFRDEDPERVRAIAADVGLDLVQLSGDEDPAAAASIGLPIVRTVRIAGGRLEGPHEGYPAAYFLLDTFDPGLPGGTGRAFDWVGASRLPLPRPFLLAGGLLPETVGEAITLLDPDGVDVSSGVESAPGIKDAEKMSRFVQAARAAWGEP